MHSMRRRLHVLACLGFACSSPVQDLGEARDGGPGGSDGAVEVTCAAFDADLTTHNQTELARLAFKLSATVLEGELRPPAGGSMQAILTVARVGRGHSGLVGEQFYIAPDQHFLSTESLPVQVIVGYAEHTIPHERGDIYTTDAPLMTLPASKRAWVADLLDYPQEGAPFVAEVSVLSKGRGQIVLRTHDALAGEIPRLINLPYSPVYIDVFPDPGAETFIASFSHISYHEGLDAFLGSLVDWRPESSRSSVALVLASPTPRFDAATIRAFAESYLLSWTFSRAPRVVAGEMLGLADECCTGAGGTFSQYEMTHDFKDGPTMSSFQVGGHAYYPSEVCGDQRIFAAGPLVPSEPDENFACTHSTSLDTSVPATQIYAMREDTPGARTQVEAWVTAEGPLLRAYPVRPGLGPEALAQLTENAPWSVPLSVAQAVARFDLAWVEVLAVDALGDGHRVTLEMSLSPQSFAPRYRVQLAFECGDPRLLVPGNVLLVPLVYDTQYYDIATVIEAGAAFLVPGVAFEPTGPAPNITSLFARELGP